MQIGMKTCFYEIEKDVIDSCIDFKDLKSIDIESVVFNGACHNVMEYLGVHKIDVLVANDSNIDKERFNYFIEIIKNNFCEKVLILSKRHESPIKGVDILNIENTDNLDMRLSLKLLDYKREIDASPSRNIVNIKTRIYNMLYSFMFSSRHDGFKYYVEAITRAYIQFPFEMSTMELYKEIADKYNKTVFAIEKGMRTALLYAFNKLKNLPSAPEVDELKRYLTYDLTNKKAINMMVSRLALNKDIKENNKVNNNFIGHIYQ